MAWLVKFNSRSPACIPEIISTPDCVGYADKAAFRDEHGFIPSGMQAQGNSIEERFWPVAGRFAVPVSVCPRLLGLCSFFLVPQSWKEVIEEFEPEVHQFKPVALSQKNGSPLDEPFFAMNIRQALRDVCDKERSTAPYTYDAKGLGAFQNTTDTPRGKVVFKAKAIRGQHLWNPLDLLIYEIAMSDELFARLASLGGMETVRTLRIEEV